MTESDITNLLKAYAASNPDKVGPRTFMMCIEEIDALHKFAHDNNVDRMWVRTTPNSLMGKIEIKDVDKSRPFTAEDGPFTDITAWERV